MVHPVSHVPTIARAVTQHHVLTVHQTTIIRTVLAVQPVLLPVAHAEVLVFVQAVLWEHISMELPVALALYIVKLVILQTAFFAKAPLI